MKLTILQKMHKIKSTILWKEQKAGNCPAIFAHGEAVEGEKVIVGRYGIIQEEACSTVV